MSEAGTSVDNVAVRRAVVAFAAEPAAHTMLEVLRQCLQGELLLDTTGAGFDPSGPPPTGASLSLNSTTAPDGAPALLAFTCADEVQRLHPGEPISTIVQRAVDVLAMAHGRTGSWLFLDPAGPTCALAAGDLDFALRVPRNDRLHAAVAAAHLDRSQRGELLAALRTEGTLLLATETDPTGMDPTEVAAVEIAPGASAEVSSAALSLRSAELADGRPALLAYTSGPEVAVEAPTDIIVLRTTTDVLALIRDSDYQALIINPAGPSALITRAELLA